MTPVYKAIFIFLAHPITNFKKIMPYLRSYVDRHKRFLLELVGNDSQSKKYDGLDDLLAVLGTRDGFFIECGGFDGVAFDPTYYLERFKGWKGIIVEPIPKMAKICRKNRKNSTVYQTALVSEEYAEDTIEFINCNMMSVTKTTRYDIDDWIKKGEEAQHVTAENITVPATTLDAVLAKYGPINKIDLLVIDVEGSEADVLNGFTLEKHKPQYLLIEISSDALKGEVLSIIGPQYKFVQKISEADHLYERIQPA